MKTKVFRLHFRFRSVTNQLETVFEDCTTTSQKNAKAIGKRLAEERAHSYAGKYWFMGIDDTARGPRCDDPGNHQPSCNCNGGEPAL